MRRLAGPYALLMLVLLVGSCSCRPAEEDRGEIYAAAVEHFVDDRGNLPDTLLVEVDGRVPSGEFLDRLGDLGVRLARSNEGRVDDDVDSDSSSTMWELSVRRAQWPWDVLSNPRWWFDSEVVAVTLYNPSPAGYGDVYGVEYRMRKSEGEWTVVEKGSEWMNGV